MKSIEQAAEDWIKKHPNAKPADIFIAGHKYKPTKVEFTEEYWKRKEQEFYEMLKPYVGKCDSSVLKKFALYWGQRSTGGKLFYEKQKCFDLPKRLATFSHNNYGNRNTTQQTSTCGSIFDRANAVLSKMQQGSESCGGF